MEYGISNLVSRVAHNVTATVNYAGRDKMIAIISGVHVTWNFSMKIVHCADTWNAFEYK